MSGGATPVVSVVTPFYNTAKYLAECIESVLAQRFTDFEYILVDNQSTDGGGEIAAHYAAKDSRIKVLRTPQFFGQCDNFNYSLRQISLGTRYCKMVLADDWLFPECLEKMVALADANPSIGLVSAYGLAGDEPWCFGLPVEQEVFSGSDAARRYLLDGLFTTGKESSVMYRADLVRARFEFFVESTIYFDTDAALRILTESDFGFVHQVLSYYRSDPESLSSRTSSYNPVAAVHMIMIALYGPSFLTDEEFQLAMKRAVDRVYNSLGRQRVRELFSACDDAYWARQRKYLAAAGLALSRRKVWQGATRALGFAMLSLGDVIKAARSPGGLVRRPGLHFHDKTGQT